MTKIHQVWFRTCDKLEIIYSINDSERKKKMIVKKKKSILPPLHKKCIQLHLKKLFYGSI